jgi:hypothetical protein
MLSVQFTVPINVGDKKCKLFTNRFLTISTNIH